MKTVRITGLAIAYHYVIEEGNTFSGSIMLQPYLIQANELPLSLTALMAEQTLERIKKKLDLKEGEFEVKYGERGKEINLNG
jgi:hypothetical protein